MRCARYTDGRCELGAGRREEQCRQVMPPAQRLRRLRREPPKAAGDRTVGDSFAQKAASQLGWVI